MPMALMIQGAGSNVGKSILVAGLCRALSQRGLKVRPFKPQNMSNNAAVTVDGGEIGRAQALQARAAGVDPITDMNPVLLKPETETGAQVVVQGKRLTTVRAADYGKLKPTLIVPVLESYNRLKSDADIVLIEGAGSPAEINLRSGDIANMGFAQAAQVPVVLTGDIDRGGVIAQLVGTKTVLDPPDENLIRGFLINKFRGDPKLFDDGYRLIEEKTGWRGLGVVPWFAEAHKLPAEDALDLPAAIGDGPIHIACLNLSRIANFDDLDPLAAEPDVRLTMVRAGEAIPGDADLVIIPGSKSTRGDLEFLRKQGWDTDLFAHVRRGGRVLGLCGGYQMLGTQILDKAGIEGPPGEIEGLGLLEVVTEMVPDKRLSQVSGTHANSGAALKGYEIHIGRSTGPDCARPFAIINHRHEGATSSDARIGGTYLHGVFCADDFRSAFLRELGAKSAPFNFDAHIENTLDSLATHIEEFIDVDGMPSIAQTGI